MNTRVLAFAVLAVVLFSWFGCSLMEGSLSGEVFIVTKGGQSFKLGLVEVKAIEQDLMKKYLKDRYELSQTEQKRLYPLLKEAGKKGLEPYQITQAYHNDGGYSSGSFASFRFLNLTADETAAANEYAAIQEKVDAVTLPSHYFTNLPKPIATSKTNADGNFPFTLRRNAKVFLVATASREVFKASEKYYWIVAGGLDGAKTATTHLSNDNMLPEDPMFLEASVEQGLLKMGTGTPEKK